MLCGTQENQARAAVMILRVIPPLVHDLPEQDEERDRQQVEDLQRAEDHLGQVLEQPVVAGGDDEGEGRGQQHEGDGHAEQHEQQEGNERHAVTPRR